MAIQFTFKGTSPADLPLANVRIGVIRWGSAWNGFQAEARHIDDFFQDLVNPPPAPPAPDPVGNYRLRLNAYGNVGGNLHPAAHLGGILPGTWLGSRQIDDDVSAGVTDAMVRTLLAGLRTSGGLPSVERNTLYFVYLPPDVGIERGGQLSCVSFCAYHDMIPWFDENGNQQDPTFYVVVAFPGCAGCQRGLSIQDALTATSSHEFINATTDPVFRRGWFDNFHGELADVCTGKTAQLGRFAVNAFWSMQPGAAQPACQ